MKFHQKPNFQPQLAWTKTYKSQIGNKHRGKCDFQELGALQSFYVQLLLIKLASGLNLDVRPKVKLPAPIGLN